MAINIKSFNQGLGDMIRKIVAETPLNDVSAGSVLLSLLEACASNDFENNVSILNVLELLNIDAVKNNDLDARAADFGLRRRSAIKASGQVKIVNSNITKQSTGLYVIKPAPIAGQNVIYVNSTAGWASSGTLYIGRGTESFEGPIAYTSITVFPTYSQISLGSALQKDHLISDSVINSQGEPDRIIASGTIVKIPANNQTPEIQYATLRDAVIPAGEDQISNIDVVALIPGSQGNAQINTITQFETLPFSGASVSNTSSFSSGKDVETDAELRNRIKSFSITLARGTAPSILSSVIGISDATDSKQVASAVLTEPVKVGDPSILYIDDGSGFQPSYAGQSVDKMLNSAEGSEEFLQLANYPLPRPQVVNVAEGPFNINDGSSLRVIVDGVEEVVTFDAANFLNNSAATVAELIVAINDKSTLFKARFANNSKSILIYPVDHAAEVIQVGAIRSSDDPTLYANNVLKFPTNEFSYIALYQNSTRLREKAKTAEISTIAFAGWNITTSGNLIISVDGTPAQDRTFILSDFPGATSFSALSLEDWVAAFNSKFAGITAASTASQGMRITSNRSAGSSVQVIGGSLLNSMFGTQATEATGQSAEFQLNRQTGNIRILTDINPGDSISAGVEDAKGFVISASSTSGNFNVSTDAQGRPAEIVIVSDSSYCTKKSIALVVDASITISDQGSSVMRITSSALDTFKFLQPNDYIYLVARTSGWISAANSGLFKIVHKGTHLSAGSDSYVEVLNNAIVGETCSIVDVSDIKGFGTDGYPQIWRGSYVGNPAAEPITNIVASLNKDVVGVKASIFKSSSIKITSTAEDGGSIALPVSVGNMSGIFAETTVVQSGNPSHIANRTSDKSLFTYFKRTTPTQTNVWLGRDAYHDVKGALTAPSTPDSAPFSAAYSETIQSTAVLNASNVDPDSSILFTKGNNRGQNRTVKAILASDTVGTQQSTAHTELDHVTGDEFQIVKPLEFSSDDSIVVVMDKDPTVKTVDIKMARTGRVNAGSNALSFTPTTTEFSANDYDNESSIDFGNTTVWGTTLNGTNFSDYAVWTRSHNWYISGGVGSGLGAMLLRAAQYGPNGDKLRFGIHYPSSANQDSAVTFGNTPSYSMYSYFFGSGPTRSISIANSDTLSVKGPYPDTSTNFPNGTVSSGNYYDYTFSGGDFSQVQIGDVLSIQDFAGISSFNRGQFSVANKSGLTARVFNPSASNTSPGTPEVSTVTTTNDILGTPTSFLITVWGITLGDDPHDILPLDGAYFKIFDTAGSVAVWFDVDNKGTPEPTHGCNRSIKVATLSTESPGETSYAVAQKIYDVINLDSAFTATATFDELTIVNKQNGITGSALAGTSAFTVATTTGTNDVSVNRKYFLLYDDEGSVAVWYDVNNNGSAEPFHGARRSIKVPGVVSGDTAANVAAATVAAINTDTKFTASNVGSAVTITATFNGDTVSVNAGTSGFTVGSTNGSLGTAELITNQDGISIYPLTGTTVSSIVSKINEGQVLVAVAVGDDTKTISKSTSEEAYSYVSNATALGYGHNPTDANLRSYIGLYDGENWVKTFQNNNPNFTLKRTYTLNGVAPSMYQMHTAPNSDITELGELFKLIPTSIKNVSHHLTQKALSQLSIVSSVDMGLDRKNVQIKSKKLGSEGAIEFIGGNGNKAKSYIFGESELASDTNGNNLLFKIPAYPDTFNIGDTVKIENDFGTKRLSRLISSDKITVTNPTTNIIEYNFNPKTTNFASGTTFTITDSSATYGRPSGTVWRWTHGGGGGVTLSTVRAGDLLYAYGTLTGWAQGNKVRVAGDGKVAGLPIINVNDVSNYIDVVNPYGKAMSSTAIGSASTVQICPTPTIRWHLAHAADIKITAISRTTNVITVTCLVPHGLNTGDSVSIKDSDNIADAVYGPVTVTSATSFTVASVGANFTEASVGASLIKSSISPTRYRIERIGYNGLTRLSRYDGESPRFLDCGVAVDDYLVISGSTFKSNNNGRFRVLAVDNNSVIYLNSQSTDELNTLVPFNNKGMQSSWTANSNTVTGLAGTFKYVELGDWVKKFEDSEDRYLQVVGFNTGVASTATTITLGGNYAGTTSAAMGVSYDQVLNVNTGISLLDAEDVATYEGDATVDGDTLFVQNVVNSDWFDVKNTGSFVIAEVGTNATTYKPFIRVVNSAGIAETNRLMSVQSDGLYVVESLANKFYSIRQISHIALDDINQSRRAVYITPYSRNYKFSNANLTSITHMGKLGYNTDVVTGVDGYLYYTGLLRRVQRTIDGYEPDAENFPGSRAVGGLIETLPPLIKKISLAINITTVEGVNLGDIANNVKSATINYVSSLGVGEDVVLSEIIAAVMQIKGVGAATFTNPVPSTERINVASNEKATLSPDDIGIA
jgi:uncharacterized phage protein gp47/JayE